MKVELISYTKNAENLCFASAKSCYSKKSSAEVIKNVKDEEVAKFLKRVVSKGHHSVLEHAVFTFSVSEVSRALTHQLIRHRIASYSQQSQRYVEILPEYVIPPKIRGKSKEKFEKLMKECWNVYQTLIKEGVDKEDARYVLPNASFTKITITMNARELLHFFSLRCCIRSQWEIRNLARKMLIEVKKVAPIIFKDAGEPCLRGYCPEEEYTCQKWKKLKKKKIIYSEPLFF